VSFIFICSIVTKKPIHDSSVVTVQFDPLSGRVVATASTDCLCKIVTCYKEGLDTNTDGPFGNITSTGETLIKL
jgi:hypothetical protein